MNARTAETLLRCYRSGKPADSRMEKAVRFAEDDPELRKMLSDQKAFDEQIIDVIHFIKPPDNLRQKLSELSVQPRAEKTRLRKQVINPAVMTAILGVIVILGIVVFLVMDRMEKFPGRESVENMLTVAGKMTGSELEVISSTFSQVGDQIYLKNYEGFESPADLGALAVIGTRVSPIETHRVAQVAVGDTENPRLVFEFHASDFGVQLPPDGDWRVLTQDEWVGAIRQHGDNCFLVAFRGTKADMQNFLKTLPSRL